MMPKRAFTLVEVLVAIAIVAILAALLLPNVKKFTEKARSAKCQSNLRQVYVAIMGYVQDNETLPSKGTGVNQLYLDSAAFETYLEPKSQAWYCPAMRGVPATQGGGRFIYNWRLTNLPSWRPGVAALRPSGIVSLSKAMLCADLDSAVRGGYHDGYANVLFADGHVENHVDVGLKDYSKVTLPADPATTVGGEYIMLQSGGKLKGYDY